MDKAVRRPTFAVPRETLRTGAPSFPDGKQETTIQCNALPAVGVTGKIRDAEIALYGPQARVKSNRGFVPLANLHLEWHPRKSSFGVLLNADALAAPQGRAADILVAATLSLARGIDFYAGYRTLEGGADNDEVFTFTWLHYAVAGLRVEL